MEWRSPMIACENVRLILDSHILNTHAAAEFLAAADWIDSSRRIEIFFRWNRSPIVQLLQPQAFRPSILGIRRMGQLAGMKEIEVTLSLLLIFHICHAKKV